MFQAQKEHEAKVPLYCLNDITDDISVMVLVKSDGGSEKGR